MRRSFYIGLIAVMTIFFIMPASAQIFGIGVKGGLNFSTLSGDFVDVNGDFGTDDVFSTQTGFVVGVSFNTSLFPLLSLQPEILYSEKGAKFDVLFDDFDIPGVGDIDASIDLAYLEVPVLLKAGLPIPGFSPFLYAGPSFAFNLSAEASYDIDVTVNGMRVSESGSEDISDEIKSFDVGIVLGGGVEFGLPTLKLHAELRYTMGLSNVYDLNNDNDDLDVNNRVLSLMVGVTF